MLEEIDHELQFNKLKKTINSEIKHCTDIGQCHVSIDVTLNEMGIDCQPYYGATIIGNHCHKLLRDNNINILFKSITLLVLNEVGKDDIYGNAADKPLLKMYTKRHFIFNSEHMLSSNITSQLARKKYKSKTPYD